MVSDLKDELLLLIEDLKEKIKTANVSELNDHMLLLKNKK